MTSRFENLVPPKAHFLQANSSTPRIENLPPRTPFTPPPPYEKKSILTHLTWDPSQQQAELVPTTFPTPVITAPQPIPGTADAQPEFKFVNDDDERQRVPFWRRRAGIILLATIGAAIIAAAVLGGVFGSMKQNSSRDRQGQSQSSLAPNPDNTSATAILSSITFAGTASGPLPTQRNSGDTGGSSSSDTAEGGASQGGSTEGGNTGGGRPVEGSPPIATGGGGRPVEGSTPIATGRV
ncbi:hypothetical protein NP233_g2529 [Leucocoprinus birnbaumii]|uniref:Uncharacterized protein n=1 Tax=Leucocoprinus birnbaumii TaxID=56174 RepID=A0AAD5VYS9_9AGAR|nr:hypothetical protein NP233_g2529 [Leucocoprinus birnbaumii]